MLIPARRQPEVNVVGHISNRIGQAITITIPGRRLIRASGLQKNRANSRIAGAGQPYLPIAGTIHAGVSPSVAVVIGRHRRRVRRRPIGKWPGTGITGAGQPDEPTGSAKESRISPAVTVKISGEDFGSALKIKDSSHKPTLKRLISPGTPAPSPSFA